MPCIEAFRQLIVIASPLKPLEVTAKGSPRRQPSLDAYSDEIENAYKALEEGPQCDIKAPTTWDLTSVKIFVSKVVNNSLRFEVDENDDIFRAGADRLVLTASSQNWIPLNDFSQSDCDVHPKYHHSWNSRSTYSSCVHYQNALAEFRTFQPIYFLFN